jgi:hypothetical protein
MIQIPLVCVGDTLVETTFGVGKTVLLAVA